MIFEIKCNACGATCHCKGTEDRETNAAEVDDKSIPPNEEWTGGNEACPHEDFEIIDAEHEQRLEDDVI